MLVRIARRRIAAAACPSKLKNQSFARRRARLRPVVSAFRKICDAAGLHDAIGREIEVALKLKPHLIEIVAMPRRIVGRRGGKLQREIAGRAGFSGQEAAGPQSPLPYIRPLDHWNAFQADYLHHGLPCPKFADEREYTFKGRTAQGGQGAARCVI